MEAPVIFEHTNNDERMLSISDRLDILQTVLKILFTDYKLPNTVCPENFKKYYIDKVNMYRNRLGHITLGEKSIQIKGNDIEINQELHRCLRRHIADVDNTIKQIETYITTEI